MDEQTRGFILALVVIAILGSIALLEFQKTPRSANFQNTSITPLLQTNCSGENCAATTQVIASKATRFPRAVELVAPDGFLNLPSGKASITVGELIGKKIIMVDFWTYSCINCQRTTPYLNAWYEKYGDKGLEIIGVHTPEFDFEKEYGNVQKAIDKFGIKYPVVQDNQYQTWTAYRNRYWPHKFIIDIDGFIVYDHIGEGGYEQTEKVIQELLKERMERLGEQQKISNETATPSAQAPGAVGSPEIYFGAWRNEYLANGAQGREGEQAFTQPQEIALNDLYLVGNWSFTQEYAENLNEGSRIVFRYSAKNVYFVASAEKATMIKVLRDGVPVGEEKGVDLEDALGESVAIVQESQLYHLIEEGESGEHTLEITAMQPGLKAYTFTFG